MKKYFDLKLFKIIALFYAIITLLTFLKRLYLLYFTQSLNEIEVVDWFRFLFSGTFLDWLLVTTFMAISIMVTKFMLIKKIKTVYIILLHICFSFLIGWFIFFFASVILFTIGKKSLIEAYNNVSFDHFIKNVDYNFITYFVLTGIIYVYFYIQKIKDVEAQKALLSNQLINTKMKALKAQLQPHFLFNTLNSISTLIESNTKQAQNTLADLSDLLREILDLKENNLITLQQELSLLKKYLDIMLIRFSDHLKINVNVDKNVENALIPSMLLQPIAENTFKHGFSYETSEIIFNLDIVKEGKSLVINVSNSGKRMNSSFDKLEKKGTGLNNTKERLQTLYGTDFDFKIYNNQKGVTTKIKIPFKKADTRIYNY